MLSCIKGCDNGLYDVRKCCLELDDLISKLLRLDCGYPYENHKIAPRLLQPCNKVVLPACSNVVSRL